MVWCNRLSLARPPWLGKPVSLLDPPLVPKGHEADAIPLIHPTGKPLVIEHVEVAPPKAHEVRVKII